MNNQRKIKFRVWDSKASFMWTEGGPELNRYDDEEFGSYPELLFWVLKDLRGEIGGDFHPNPGDYTLQQFIGILDKNSKEIYEGDIVTANLSYSSDTKTTGVVEFSQETLNYVLKFTFEDEIYWEDLCMYRDFEVIGNIYENFDILQNMTNLNTE